MLKMLPIFQRAIWYSLFGLLAILFLFGATADGRAQSTKPVTALSGRIIDQAALLSPKSKAELNARLEAHEKKTGNQLVVFTIPSLNGANLEEFSLRHARSWALGQKDLNNGVLFLVAKNDRKMRIEVGYGLEGTLTDAIASFIIRATVAPLFKQGLFDGGIVAGTGQIIEVLEADKSALETWRSRAKKTKSNKGDPQWPIFLFIGIWLMIFFGGIVSSVLVRRFGTEIKPGHYRWLGMDAGPNAPKPKRSSSSSSGGGWSSGGGGFSGGGGSFGGGGSSGSW